MKGRGSIFHDMRSSLNGVICMGSLLEETDLSDEQADILKYMLLSAEKTLNLIENFQKNTINDSSFEANDGKAASLSDAGEAPPDPSEASGSAEPEHR